MSCGRQPVAAASRTACVAGSTSGTGAGVRAPVVALQTSAASPTTSRSSASTGTGRTSTASAAWASDVASSSPPAPRWAESSRRRSPKVQARRW